MNEPQKKTLRLERGTERSKRPAPRRSKLPISPTASLVGEPPVRLKTLRRTSQTSKQKSNHAKQRVALRRRRVAR